MYQIRAKKSEALKTMDVGCVVFGIIVFSPLILVLSPVLLTVYGLGKLARMTKYVE